MLYGKQSTREREREMGEKTANILRYAHKKKYEKKGGRNFVVSIISLSSSSSSFLLQQKWIEKETIKQPASIIKKN
jgi:hypothetical protein